MRTIEQRAKLIRGLNRLDRLAVEFETTKLKYKDCMWFIRMAGLHIGTTAVILTAFPPASEVPPIAIPIVWAGSFCTALIIMTFIPVLRV
jgi:hypothetical protein